MVSATGYLQQAQALMAVGRYTEAVTALERAVAQEPDAAEPRCELAVAFLNLNRFEDANKMAGSALPLCANSEAPHRIRSIGLRQLGKRREALAEAQAAVRLGSGNYATHFVLAEALLASKRLNEAAAAAVEGRALAPQLPLGHDVLGRVALQRRQWDNAEGHFRQALALDPADWVVMNHLGEALERRRRLKEAMEVYEAAAKLNPRARVSQNRLLWSTRNYIDRAGAAVGILGLVALWAALTVSDKNPTAAVLLAVLGLAALGGSAYLSRRRRRSLSRLVQRFYLTAWPRQRLRLIKWALLLCGLIVLAMALFILGAAVYYGQLRF